MKEVLEKLRESFNFILIDSPPAVAVSDAAVLSINSDAVILVFHARKTTRASARQVMERLEAVRAPILGTILNGVNFRNPDYAYYRYYYGSKYGVIGRNNNDSDGAIETMDAASEAPEMSLASIEFGSGVLPRPFFDTIISKFSEAVGPMAPVIVVERVALLGETLDTFPQARLSELFDELSHDILNAALRRQFEAAMVDELKSL
jgi:Mrp family chromosome partitioning ATPase